MVGSAGFKTDNYEAFVGHQERRVSGMGPGRVDFRGKRHGNANPRKRRSSRSNQNCQRSSTRYFHFIFIKLSLIEGNYYTNPKLNTSQSKLIVPALCRPFFFSGTGHYYNSTRSTCRETRNCATSSCFFRPLEFLLKSGHPDPANSGRGSSFVFRRGAVFCIRRCCRSRCGSLGVDREQ